MKKTLATAVLTLLAFSLSSCGNDDAEASKALSDSIMKSQDTQGGSSQFFSMKRKDANCIGDGLVEEIGTDQLQEYGLLTKENKADKSVADAKMSAKDSEAATGVLFDCTDVASMMQAAITRSGSVPAAMKDCVNKTLTEENLRPVFTMIFQGKQAEAQKELTTPMMRCAAGSAG
jgi:predicted small secreted protein